MRDKVEGRVSTLFLISAEVVEDQKKVERGRRGETKVLIWSPGVWRGFVRSAARLSHKKSWYGSHQPFQPSENTYKNACRVSVMPFSIHLWQAFVFASSIHRDNEKWVMAHWIATHRHGRCIIINLVRQANYIWIKNVICPASWGSVSFLCRLEFFRLHLEAFRIDSRLSLCWCLIHCLHFLSKKELHNWYC